MLRWTTALYLIGLIAALLGFGGLTVVNAGIARLLIVLFLAAFLGSLVALAVGVSRYEQSTRSDGPSALGTPLPGAAPTVAE